MDNTLGNTLQKEDNIRRPKQTAIKTTSYNVTNKKNFITNNKGKTLVHIYQEDIYEPPTDKIYPPLADSLIIMTVAPSQSSKPKVKAPPCRKTTRKLSNNQIFESNSSQRWNSNIISFRL